MPAKKSIVFINQSSGYLMIDIINEHLKYYDEVTLFTGFLNSRNKVLNAKVNVKYLKKYNRESSYKRFVSWIIFFIQSLFLLIFKYKKANIYFVSNPPILVFLARMLNRKFCFLIYDVYPNTFVEYKVLKRESFLVKLWQAVNKNVFQKSKHIFTIGEGMKVILSEYIPSVKIKVVPIWTDNSFLKPIKKEVNPFIEKHKLKSHFNIIYSGNIGKTHPVEVLLDIAEQIEDPLFRIIIIGEGEKKSKLEKLKSERSLKNVKFLPYQSMGDFPYSLAATDIGVVTLGEQASKLSVPSKTFNLMSVGAPILAITGLDSELSHLLKKYKNGQAYRENQITEIIEYIKKVQNNHSFRGSLQQNAIAASKHYTPNNAKELIFID